MTSDVASFLTAGENDKQGRDADDAEQTHITAGLGDENVGDDEPNAGSGANLSGAGLLHLVSVTSVPEPEEAEEIQGEAGTMGASEARADDMGPVAGSGGGGATAVVEAPAKAKKPKTPSAKGDKPKTDKAAKAKTPKAGDGAKAEGSRSKTDPSGDRETGAAKADKQKSPKTGSKSKVLVTDFPDEDEEDRVAPSGRLRKETAAVGRRRLSVGLGLLCVALAAALVVSLVQLNEKNNAAAARTSALAAAKVYSTELASYSYQHLGADFGAVLSHSTPSFKTSFTQSSDALKTTLARYKATAQAKIVAEGIVSESPTQMVVLVFLDQTVTNSASKAPTTDRSQVELTLVPSGSGWLIKQVTLL